MRYLLLLLIFLLSSTSRQSILSSSSPLPKSQFLCLDHQRSALVQLRQDVLNHSSPPVTYEENSSMKVLQWDLESDCCSWEGVTCDAIPTEISRLTKLKSLDISTIPFCERPLNFDGPDFIRVYEFEELHRLKLEEPNLQMFVHNMNNLTELNLDNVDLSAQGPIHSSFSQLQSISHINLEVPNLAFLLLSSNLLNGVIYSSLFTLPSLQGLCLDNNHFSGQLEEFSNASSSELKCLYFNGNDLSGPIPKSISKLPRLVYLELAANNFYGTMKLDIFQSLRNLNSLDLSDNKLSIEGDNGSFMLPNLAALKLSRCNLTEVPKFLKNQVGLKTLNLSNNQIHGSVPSWIRNSGSLYELDLSQNAVDFLEQPLLDDSNQSKTVIDG
ncbi:unnamed protein product, partial [Ilex paraguariensis]